MAIPSGLSEKAAGIVSKKLGVAGGGVGVITYLTSLGLSPDKAGLYVVIICGLFIVGQAIVDYRKEGVKGLLVSLKKVAGDLGPATEVSKP